MCLSVPDYGKTAIKQEKERQTRVEQGIGAVNAAYSGFNEPFYQNRVNAYTRYAMPQLAEQYRDTSNQLRYAMGNRGLVGSSAMGEARSALNRNNTRAVQAVGDTAIGQAQALRQQVENSRSNLLNQLYQTAEPAGAASAATGTAASFAMPSAMPSLGNMFNQFAQSYYLSNLLNASKQSYAMPQNQQWGQNNAAVNPQYKD
jgi:hypothetical protein